MGCVEQVLMGGTPRWRRGREASLRLHVLWIRNSLTLVAYGSLLLLNQLFELLNPALESANISPIVGRFVESFVQLYLRSFQLLAGGSEIALELFVVAKKLIV